MASFPLLRRSLGALRVIASSQQSLWRNKALSRALSSSSRSAVVSAVRPSFEDRRLRVQWDDGEESNFHYVWLRDRCECSACQDPTSHQKTVAVRNMPKDPVVSHAWTEGKNVVVEWNDSDHPQQSIFSAKWLKTHCYSTSSRAFRRDSQYPTLWKKDDVLEVPRVSYSDSMSYGGEGLLETLSIINEFGFCILEDVPTEEKAVLKVANHIGYIHETLYGREFDVTSITEPNNIAYSSKGLELHQDLCYYEAPPGLQLLHCMQFSPSVKGGESTFADGFMIAEDFRTRFPHHFETLCRVPVTYHYRQPGHTMRYRRPIFEVDPEDESCVTKLFYSPPFTGPLDVAEEDVVPFFEAYRALNELVESGDYTLELKMEPGQCSVFNNRRIFHGRREFELTSKEDVRHFQGTYVSMDEFTNKLRTLYRQHVNDDLADDTSVATMLGNSTRVF